MRPMPLPGLITLTPPYFVSPRLPQSNIDIRDNMPSVMAHFAGQGVPYISTLHGASSRARKTFELHHGDINVATVKLHSNIFSAVNTIANSLSCERDCLDTNALLLLLPIGHSSILHRAFAAENIRTFDAQYIASAPLSCPNILASQTACLSECEVIGKVLRVAIGHSQGAAAAMVAAARSGSNEKNFVEIAREYARCLFWSGLRIQEATAHANVLELPVCAALKIADPQVCMVSVSNMALSSLLNRITCVNGIISPAARICVLLHNSVESFVIGGSSVGIRAFCDHALRSHDALLTSINECNAQTQTLTPPRVKGIAATVPFHGAAYLVDAVGRIFHDLKYRRIAQSVKRTSKILSVSPMDGGDAVIGVDPRQTAEAFVCEITCLPVDWPKSITVATTLGAALCDKADVSLIHFGAQGGDLMSRRALASRWLKVSGEPESASLVNALPRKFESQSYTDSLFRIVETISGKTMKRDADLPLVAASGLSSIGAIAVARSLRSMTHIESISDTLLYDYPTAACVTAYMMKLSGSNTSNHRNQNKWPLCHVYDSNNTVAATRMVSETSSQGSVFVASISSSRQDSSHDSVVATISRRHTMKSHEEHTLPVMFGSFLVGIDMFDSEMLGVKPKEAAIADPQQRLLLNGALNAEILMHVNIESADSTRGTCGVYVGISYVDYSALYEPDRRSMKPYTASGKSLSVASGRLAFCFNLRGPTLSVDTAC